MTTPGKGADRLRGFLTACTLVWLAIYFPLETYITWDEGGVGAWLWSSYVLDVVGMALMFWGGLAAMKRRPEAPALLATGWSWTAATFWRATANRFWWVAEGRELGPIELWLAVGLTAIAVAMTSGSILLVFKSTRGESVPAIGQR